MEFFDLKVLFLISDHVIMRSPDKQKKYCCLVWGSNPLKRVHVSPIEKFGGLQKGFCYLELKLVQKIALL